MAVTSSGEGEEAEAKKIPNLEGIAVLFEQKAHGRAECPNVLNTNQPPVKTGWLRRARVNRADGENLAHGGMRTPFYFVFQPKQYTGGVVGGCVCRYLTKSPDARLSLSS